MPHHHTNVEVDRPHKWVFLGVLGHPGLLVNITRIRGEVDTLGKLLRVVSYPLKEIYHIAIKVIHGFYSASFFSKQYSPGTKKRLQIAVMFRKLGYNPFSNRPLCARVFYYGSHLYTPGRYLMLDVSSMYSLGVATTFSYASLP